MIYLLTLGWPWFAGALALGALVGFLTFSRASNVAFSSGWAVVLGAFALAAAGAVSWSELLEGREAAAFDIALLASLAYAVGLPIGGAAKSLGGPAAEEKRPAPARIVAPQPILVPEAAAEPHGATAPIETPQRSSAEAKKKTPGVRPETLASPRNGAPDDLSRIKGIGPKSRQKLNALGVFHYDQIAGWNLDNAKWIGATIGAPGRVERDKWIQQARALAGAGTDH